MKKIKIFLASSIVEFKDIRHKIGEYVLEYNNKILDQEIKIKLFECEYYDSSISVLNRKQDEYMEILKESDIFVMFVGKKLGNYTKEEYELAKKENIQRNIFFFKSKDIDSSVIDFKKELINDHNAKIYEINIVQEIKDILYYIFDEQLT